MDTINIVLITFILITTLYMFTQQINEHFNKQSPLIDECVVELKEHFPDITELRFYEGDESYTLNKEKVYVCIRDKKTQELYDKNILKYVILHEYAHYKCPEIGHTPMWQDIFDDIVKKAIDLKLYDPTVQIPVDYCK